LKKKRIYTHSSTVLYLEGPTAAFLFFNKKAVSLQPQFLSEKRDSPSGRAAGQGTQLVIILVVEIRNIMNKKKEFFIYSSSQQFIAIDPFFIIYNIMLLCFSSVPGKSRNSFTIFSGRFCNNNLLW
jgi:hypothetical protein